MQLKKVIMIGLFSLMLIMAFVVAAKYDITTSEIVDKYLTEKSTATKQPVNQIINNIVEEKIAQDQKTGAYNALREYEAACHNDEYVSQCVAALQKVFNK